MWKFFFIFATLKHQTMSESAGMMNRTFHYRVTVVNMLLPVLLLAVAFHFFWIRGGWNVLAGLGVMLLAVVVVERLLHTEYRFEGDRLLISRGRFARVTIVPLKDITRVQHISRRWLSIDYLWIEYGARHTVSVQPQNMDAFLKEIHKRQDED